MATTSTFVTIKQAVVDALAAHANLSGIPVTYAWVPYGDKDQVFLGPSTNFTSDIATLKSGRKHRRETYTFEVVFRSIDNDGTPQTFKTTETKAASMFAALEDVLADDPQIDGLSQIDLAKIISVDVESGKQDKGWVSQITALVEVEARLQ